MMLEQPIPLLLAFLSGRIALTSSFLILPDCCPVSWRYAQGLKRRKRNAPIRRMVAAIEPGVTSRSIMMTHEEIESDETIEEFLKYIQDGKPFSLTIKESKRQKKKKTPTSHRRGSIRRITIRSPIQLKQRNATQFTYQYNGATDVVKNYNVGKETRETLRSLLRLEDCAIPATEWGSPGNLQRATLQTAHHRILLQLGKKPTLQTLDMPSNTTTTALGLMNSTTAQHQTHDRHKRRVLDITDPLWQELGITTRKDASLKPGMKSKFRQCEKFVEIVSRLIPQQAKRVSTVDMGCGRGYVTFALHSYLAKLQHYDSVQTVGIDIRPKLVAEISSIAEHLGMDGLDFTTGTIASQLQQPQEPKTTMKDFQILIALHACDTATDDALWSGIQSNADLLVVAPCCHKQVRSQLERHNNNQHPYDDVLRHGIYRERMAETMTDALRALLLEYAGYTSVQVFEFIGGEHTAKNVMITALRSKTPARPRESMLLQRIRQLAAFHGIREQALASWMGLSLVDDSNEKDTLITPPFRNGGRMPPLER